MLDSEICTLLAKCAIELAMASLAFYAHVFLVPKKNGKQRRVFNMKPLNKFIVGRSFRVAILKMVTGSPSLGNFVVSLDFSDTYFHVHVAPSDRHFLRFKFKGRLYQFNRMTFGLSSAPQIFTTLMCPIMAFCRLLGIWIIFYLGD